MRFVRSIPIVVIALVASAASACAGDLMPWQPNLETAQQLAARTNRLVLIHFWAPWCQPCLRLEKDVFSNPETARALEANFVLVKINTDEAPGTTRMYGVSSLPADVITMPGGRLVSHIQSPPTAGQYIAQLNQAAAGHRELVRKAAQQSAAISPQSPGAAPPADAAPGTSPATASPVAAAMPQAPVADPYAQQAAPQAPAVDRYGNPAVAPQAPVADPYANPSAAPQPAYTDRYAEYFHQPPSAAPPAAGPQSMTSPPGAAQPPMTPPSSSPVVAATASPAYNAPASYEQQTSAPQLPPGCPPVALDGNCPVTLVEHMQWAVGDRAWGAIHRGRTYLFRGQEQREKFLANPDLYSPVMSGIDPVLALDNQMIVQGRREFGVFGADRRIYLFADEASLKRFEQNPNRYAAEAVQARR